MFDVSEANGGVPFDTLYDALTYADSVLLDSQKKGGMTIKYVQSSDNKYIQAICMAQNFTTDVTQWQGVDDEPTVGSENLIKSGGLVPYIINDIENQEDNLYICDKKGNIIALVDSDGLKVGKIYLKRSNGKLEQLNVDVFNESLSPDEYVICDYNNNVIFQVGKDGVTFKNNEFKFEHNNYFKDFGHPKFQTIDGDYCQFIIYGQSLAVGVSGFVDDSENPNTYEDDNCLCIGTDIYDADANGIIREDTDYLSVIPTRPYRYNVLHTTIQSFSAYYKRFVKENQKFVASCCGKGGMTVYGLSKDNDKLDVNYYSVNFLRTIHKMKNIADAENKSVRCPAILWLQGANDNKVSNDPSTNIPNAENFYSCCGNVE